MDDLIHFQVEPHKVFGGFLASGKLSAYLTWGNSPIPFIKPAEFFDAFYGFFWPEQTVGRPKVGAAAFIAAVGGGNLGK